MAKRSIWREYETGGEENRWNDELQKGGRPSGGKGARQIGRISVLLSLNRLTTRHKLDWKLEMPREKSRGRFSASGNLLKARRNDDNM